MAGSTWDAYQTGPEAAAAKAAAQGQQPAVTASVSAGGKAPPKADAARTPTLVSGLADALNRFEQERSGPEAGKPQLYPDRYQIIIVDQVLQQAKVIPPGATNLKQVPMTQAQTANQQKNPATQKVDNNAKTSKITAGMSILQFLDLVVRTSSYIYDQQTSIYDAKKQELMPVGTPAETVGWYRIGIQAEPQLDKFDTKRNDYAYDITYQINIYAVSDVKSPYFPPPKFRGTQKKYNYWFTGENTQVLDFNQDFNYLYYIAATGPTKPRTGTSDFREIEKRYAQVNSPESSQGQDNDKVNEPSASAADYLYSPGDQSRLKMRIVGDPAWVFQGELWSGVAGDKFDYGPFLPDGTINIEGQEILFEFAFNKPVDYDLATGLADPTTKNFNKSATSAGDARQSYIYKAIECDSTFSRGQFTQELTAVLQIYPLPNKSKSDTSRLTAAKENLGTSSLSPTYQRARAIDQRLFDTYKIPPVGTDLQFENTLYGGTTNSASDGIFTPAPLTSSAPTSGSQTVGPGSSGSVAVAAQGGASGTNVGQPVEVNVYLNNNNTVSVVNEDQIVALRRNGQLSAQAASAATNRLRLAQQAANSPIAATPPQRGAKEA